MRPLSSLGIFVAAGLIAVGCATPQSQELQQAESSYSQAENNETINRHAPVALREAKQDLDRAKAADDVDEQKHFAYLAQKKIDLARNQATQADTREEVANLQQQQDEFLLAMRRQQAEQARTEAEQAQQQLQTYQAREREQELTRAQEETQEAQSELQQLREQMSDMDAKQTDRGTVLTLSGVVFETDKAELKSGAERNLSQLADYLRRNPDKNIRVEGFTDSTGSAEYNQALSERRALEVARALQNQGISPDRISTRGLGQDYPVATNATPAGRQQNRRVEITILNPGQQEQSPQEGRGRM